MISRVCLTMRAAMSFLPLLRPLRIKAQQRRSTMGHCCCRMVAVCGVNDVGSTETRSKRKSAVSVAEISSQVNACDCTKLGWVVIHDGTATAPKANK